MSIRGTFEIEITPPKVFKREFVRPLSRAVAAVGVDGFFFETHFDPCIALCDGPNMLYLEDLDAAIKDIQAIQNSLKA